MSNIVSANDCANVGLAVGASPMMAQAPEEMAEITARSAATVLNTGTPSAEKFSACMICGVESQRLGKPVVLDPVGIGASAWRLRWADELLAAFHPEILRVNFGEARALAHGAAEESGVDSLAQASTMARLALARRLARQAGSVVLLSGPEDIVTNGLDAFCIRGGSARTAQVTGAGCMLSVLCGAFAAVEPNPLQAAALAAAFWKVCSQRAERARAGARHVHVPRGAAGCGVPAGRGDVRGGSRAADCNAVKIEDSPPVPSGAGVVFCFVGRFNHPSQSKNSSQPSIGWLLPVNALISSPPV